MNMSRYDDCSREELIRRIEELERQLGPADRECGRFRERYACKILDSIPDMLTVLDRQGQLVELVSAEETNHVGVPSGEIAGQNIREMLSSEAYRNVRNNLENVFATGCGSSSHHDITLDGRTRNYENRIFPLDGEHALCICRDITDAEAAKHELGDGQIRAEQRRRGDLRLRPRRHDGVRQRTVPPAPQHHRRTVLPQGL